MTPRLRSILHHYLVTSDYSAKDTGAAFGISERRVNQVVRDAMDQYRCSTRRELARFVERRLPVAVSLPIW